MNPQLIEQKILNDFDEMAKKPEVKPKMYGTYYKGKFLHQGGSWRGKSQASKSLNDWLKNLIRSEYFPDYNRALWTERNKAHEDNKQVIFDSLKKHFEIKEIL